jgi:hypothetical protein
MHEQKKSEQHRLLGTPVNLPQGSRNQRRRHGSRIFDGFRPVRFFVGRHGARRIFDIPPGRRFPSCQFIVQRIDRESQLRKTGVLARLHGRRLVAAARWIHDEFGWGSTVPNSAGLYR